jgi:hypothetical protein
MLFASQANMPLVFWCSKLNVYRFIKKVDRCIASQRSEEESIQIVTRRRREIRLDIHQEELKKERSKEAANKSSRGHQHNQRSVFVNQGLEKENLQKPLHTFRPKRSRCVRKEPKDQQSFVLYQP